MLWSSVTVGAFGILGDAPDGLIYFVSCLVCRIVNGIGASMLYSTAMPIAVQMYPDKAGLVTTMVQTCLGLGLCLGPPVGSVLLSFGGYKGPFLTVASIEFVVFLMGVFAIPAKGAKAKAKPRNSEYFRFLAKFSALSVVIPSAMIFSMSGIRDSAYSLYFENVLNIDSKTVGFIFLSNSVGQVLTGPAVGVFVEIGYGAYVEAFVQIMGPIVAFSFFIPKFLPALECVSWGTFMLFANGCEVASIMTTYLILEKVALKQGLTNMQQIKTIVASSYNLIMSGGRMFGSFVVGGFINDKVGFYDMCLVYGIILCVSAVWHISFLFKVGFIRKLFYNNEVDVKFIEDKGKVGLSTSTGRKNTEYEDDSSDENVDDDIMVWKASISTMLLTSMSRSQNLNR